MVELVFGKKLSYDEGYQIIRQIPCGVAHIFKKDL